MPTIQPFAPGNYRFITHAFQYSGGVSAEPGFAIERARFARPLPPSCACKWRWPKKFTEQGFIDFNRHYVQRLEKWGIFRDEINPVARSNVCPEINPPAMPSFYAFCYTVPGGGTSFVAAGSGEASDGPGSYAERIVRLGDQSPDGMRDKARYVRGAMERRMGALGFGWPDVTATQVYTVFNLHPIVPVVFDVAAAGGGTPAHGP